MRIGIVFILMSLIGCASDERLETKLLGTWTATDAAEGSKGMGIWNRVKFEKGGRCRWNWGNAGKYTPHDDDTFEVIIYQTASELKTTGRYLRDRDRIEVMGNSFERTRE